MADETTSTPLVDALYHCPHCQHRSAGWIVLNGVAWCPQCFKGTQTERAIVRIQPTPPPAARMNHDDGVQAIKDLFGWL